MNMPDRIYFDYAATTPTDPRVARAREPFLSATCGNPAGLRQAGRQARAAVECAREQVARLLNAKPNEIVFTASGSEADNLALRGALEAAGPGPVHMVTSAIEHSAVLATCRALERRRGVEVARLPASADGVVEPSQFSRAIRPETRLVSIMTANPAPCLHHSVIRRTEQ
jgi:cysteine desulfurase